MQTNSPPHRELHAKESAPCVMIRSEPDADCLRITTCAETRTADKIDNNCRRGRILTLPQGCTVRFAGLLDLVE